MEKSIKKSTFLLQSGQNKGFGTAFAIYNDNNGSYLVTCAHVIDTCGKDNLLVENKHAILLKIGSTAVIDLALIYVEGLDSIELKLTTLKVKKGTPFEIEGFKNHLHNNYKLETLKGSIKKTTTVYSQSQPVERYELSIDKDDDIYKGYSGSAIICPNSKHVMAVATSRYHSKSAEAIPIKYLKTIWREIPDEVFTDESCVLPQKKIKKYLLGTVSGMIIIGLFTNYIYDKIKPTPIEKTKPTPIVHIENNKTEISSNNILSGIGGDVNVGDININIGNKE